MEDTYVYVSVKIYLTNGQTEESIQEVIQEMDYSFTHDSITDHEIVDILDFQVDDNFTEPESLPTSNVDVFDLSGMPEYKIDE
tara:strand:- start:6915 stop:7163 length:249 start_codon:yes stop_codon:yes gene_type:complete